MKYISILIFLSLALIAETSIAQSTLGSITDDEGDLYAQTKQLNQFFRRFNNEEDLQGNRSYPGDAEYRSANAREHYLNILFDKESTIMTKKLKKEFIEKVNNSDAPVFLDFHDDLWFAELAAYFQHNDSKESLMLFLQLEKENLGYKWVITKTET